MATHAPHDDTPADTPSAQSRYTAAPQPYVRRCRTKGCTRTPEVVVASHTVGPHPFCIECSKYYIASDHHHDVREYPIEMFEATDGTTLRRIGESGGGVSYELSDPDERAPEAWVVADNTMTDTAHRQSVVNLDGWC